MYATPHKDPVMDASGWLLLQLHIILDGDKMHEVIDWTCFGSETSPETVRPPFHMICLFCLQLTRWLPPSLGCQIHLLSSHVPSKTKRVSPLDGTTEVIQKLAAKGISVLPPSAAPLASPLASSAAGAARSGADNDNEDEDDEDDEDVLGGYLQQETSTEPKPNDPQPSTKLDPRFNLYRAPVDPSSITKKYQQVYAALSYYYPKLGHHGHKGLTKQLLEMGYSVGKIAFALGWSNSVMETIYGNNAIPHNVRAAHLSVFCYRCILIFDSIHVLPGPSRRRWFPPERDVPRCARQSCGMGQRARELDEYMRQVDFPAGG